MTIEEIDTKLEALREKYKVTFLFQDREIIKRQARALNIAKEKIYKKNPQLSIPTVGIVEG